VQLTWSQGTCSLRHCAPLYEMRSRPNEIQMSSIVKPSELNMT
jgi:hypothetical protein